MNVFRNIFTNVTASNRSPCYRNLWEYFSIYRLPMSLEGSRHLAKVNTQLHLQWTGIEPGVRWYDSIF
jgi:hypothetical protein